MNVQRMHEVLAAVPNYCRIDTKASWSDVAAIRKLFDLKVLELVETVHHSRWHHIAYEHKDATLTYDGCIELSIDKQARVHMTVWNGDSYVGHPTKKRETYIFTGDWFAIAAVFHAVEKAFTRRVTQQLKEEDEAAFQKRVEERSHKLLEAEDE
jgi:hypothetical protein